MTTSREYEIMKLITAFEILFMALLCFSFPTEAMIIDVSPDYIEIGEKDVDYTFISITADRKITRVDFIYLVSDCKDKTGRYLSRAEDVEIRKGVATGILTLPYNILPGYYSIRTEYEEEGVGRVADCFPTCFEVRSIDGKVNPNNHIAAVHPREAFAGDTLQMTIDLHYPPETFHDIGLGFGCNESFLTHARNIVIESEKAVSCTIDLTGIPPGRYTLAGSYEKAGQPGREWVFCLPDFITIKTDPHPPAVTETENQEKPENDTGVNWKKIAGVSLFLIGILLIFQGHALLKKAED